MSSQESLWGYLTAGGTIGNWNFQHDRGACEDATEWPRCNHYVNLMYVGNQWWPQAKENCPGFLFGLALISTRDLHSAWHFCARERQQFHSSSTVIRGQQLVRNSPTCCHKVVTHRAHPTHYLSNKAADRWGDCHYTMQHTTSCFAISSPLVWWKFCFPAELCKSTAHRKAIALGSALKSMSSSPNHFAWAFIAKSLAASERLFFLIVWVFLFCFWGLKKKNQHFGCLVYFVFS